VVVYMNSGNGQAPIVAARTGRASRIVSTDRNIVSIEAARRTLSANPGRAVEIIPGHGTAGIDEATSADTVAIRIPHEKLALIQLLFDAFRILRIGGTCYVAGANNEGIKTAAKLLEQAFGNSTLLAYDSGNRIVSAVKNSDTPASDDVFDSPFLPHDAFREIDATLRGQPLKIFSRPGVFSWDHLDEATEILADHIDIPAGASVLDLGCGSGPLGIVASRLSGGAPVVMVDADVEAVRSAGKSAEAAGISNYRVLPSDVAGAVIEERFDVVVTNPPFHVGKQTELSVPMQFIEDSWEVLSPGGRLFLVANRTLPYEGAIKRRFGNVSMVHDGRRFKVLSAAK
ncbi:MAG TPA: class I SAM-dependent methyltransferase, partial [Gemmatimonadaceae bacterium]|nr:class I SAM-dependent methyltransferase [Gemmatimonadaceae bacterium]